MSTKARYKTILCVFMGVIIICVLSSCSSNLATEKTTEVLVDITEENNEDGLSENSNARLYVPTMIQKIDNTYFIMDCWQHRVLYSNDLNVDLSEWWLLTDTGYNGGHTIASDGELYVLDNTDANQVLCYKKNDDGSFDKVFTIGNITTRPHFVVYDEVNKKFYVIGSTSGIIYVFQNYEGSLSLVREYVLNELQESYVRSISIIDGNLYAVSGKN